MFKIIRQREQIPRSLLAVMQTAKVDWLPEDADKKWARVVWYRNRQPVALFTFYHYQGQGIDNWNLYRLANVPAKAAATKLLMAASAFGVRRLAHYTDRYPLRWWSDNFHVVLQGNGWFLPTRQVIRTADAEDETRKAMAPAFAAVGRWARLQHENVADPRLVTARRVACRACPYVENDRLEPATCPKVGDASQPDAEADIAKGDLAIMTREADAICPAARWPLTVRDIAASPEVRR